MAFAQCFAEAEGTAAESERETTLLYLDIDRFKRVNDTLGHDAGDILIRQFADRLRSITADRAVAARLGGDEFAILAPDRPTAEGMARTILVSCDEPCDLGSQRLSISVSIGMASVGADNPDLSETMRRADQALYAAKAAGRGVARTYTADMAPPLAVAC